MTTQEIAILEAAIDRSRSHNEIVHVTVAAEDISEVLSEIAAIYDGEIDDSRENDGTYGVWGHEAGSDNEMEWRLVVTLTNETKITEVRIDLLFGEYEVCFCDSSGVWQSIQSGQCTFATLDAAQDYLDDWMENDDTMVQVDGIEI